jgi:hypothetical protein
MGYILAAAGVAAGGALIGGYFSGQASQNAANTQASAADRASAVSQAQYDQTRADQAPYRQAGYGALGGMQQDYYGKNFSMDDFKADPGYQFNLDEGNKAINAAASARGMSNSGATMKALTAYGANMANQQYGAAYDRYNNDKTTTFNRLASLAGLGQTANTQTGAAGMNNSNAIANNTMSAANAQSAAMMAGANATNGAIGGATNSFMQYNMMNQMFPKQGGAAPMSNMSSMGAGGYGAGASTGGYLGNFNLNSEF